MKNNKTFSNLKNVVILVFTTGLVFAAFPFFNAYRDAFKEKFKDVKSSENFNGGKLIAEFNDPVNDLIRPMNPNYIYRNFIHELDVIKFTISKVEFSKLSALDMPARINFIYNFSTPLKIKYNSNEEFSLPLIHILIDSPHINNRKNRNPDLFYKLNGPDWDYKIIIGGNFSSAQIYTYDGKKIENPIPTYKGIKEQIIYGIRVPNKSELELKHDVIMAGVPIEIIGDMSKGEWSIYTFTTINDPANPGSSMPSNDSDLPIIYDIIYPENILNIDLAYGPRPQLLPLQIANH